MKRFVLLIISVFTQILLVAQTQFDYMDDDAVAGGADRALNGIIIIVVLVIAAIVLLFIISGLLNVYYWFNPKADPSYKRLLAKQEQERKHEEYVKGKRRHAFPNAVDIGLSVKWASFNLGAYKPSDVGSMFYWAENQSSTIGYPKYCKIKIDVIGDIAGDEKYDAATNMLGRNWRLPTEEECRELLNMCKWETKVIDGIEGRLVTGPNGNSIFLPFNQKNITSGKYVSGHYWTSTPHHGSESANDLRFGENCKQPAELWCATACRCLFGIRPVYTTVTRAMSEIQKVTETKKAYEQILEREPRLTDTECNYKLYQEQCIIHEDEKVPNINPLLGGICFVEDKILRDEHGIIYSLDGKRLLEGRHCDCKTQIPVVLVFLPVTALLIALLIPLQLVSGVEKSRVVISGACGVMGASVIAFAELVKTNVLSAFSFLNQMNGWILAGIAVVVTVLLILLSYAISVRIMEKKEF